MESKLLPRQWFGVVKDTVCLHRVIISNNGMASILIVFLCININISIALINHNTPFIFLHHITIYYDMFIACKELHWFGMKLNRLFEVQGFFLKRLLVTSHATNHISHFKINWAGIFEVEGVFEEIASKTAGGQWCIKIPVHIVNIHCTYGEYTQQRKFKL